MVMKFDIIKIFEGSYKPVNCSCGGSLYDKSGGKDLRFTCMRCEKLIQSGNLNMIRLE